MAAVGTDATTMEIAYDDGDYEEGVQPIHVRLASDGALMASQAVSMPMADQSDNGTLAAGHADDGATASSRGEGLGPNYRSGGKLSWTSEEEGVLSRFMQGHAGAIVPV